ncbi:MAG: hypothetical protein KDI01_08235 [Halioglobus sp.]|nr:hypothetical protein [Halioglobus sp.]
MFDPKMIVEPLQALLGIFTADDSSPPTPTGVDAWDPACQPRTLSQLSSVADRTAIADLARLDPVANAVLNSHGPSLDIAMQPFADVSTAGFTRRSSTAGKTFDIRLNHNRLTPSHFDTALTFIHELAHVARIVDLGFTPAELVTAIDEVRDYVALVWQFEYSAFEAMLNGAVSIHATDTARFAECWHISVANDAILAALHAGNTQLARNEIKVVYPETEQRQYWNDHHGDTPLPQAAPLWLAYYGLGQADDPSLWGL